MAGSLSHERAHLMHLSPASMNVECGAVLGRLVPRASPLPPETRRGMHMGTSCAVMNFQRYLEVHPYLGGARLSEKCPLGRLYGRPNGWESRRWGLRPYRPTCWTGTYLISSARWSGTSDCRPDGIYRRWMSATSPLTFPMALHCTIRTTGAMLLESIQVSGKGSCFSIST